MNASRSLEHPSESTERRDGRGDAPRAADIPFIRNAALIRRWPALAWLPLLCGVAGAGPLTDPSLPPLQEPNASVLVALLSEPAAEATPAIEPTSLLTDPPPPGTPVRVRGRYAGRQRAVEAGGVGLTEWGVIANSAGEDLPLVIYLPRRSVRPPRRGADVAGTARFLSVWTDVDATGAARRYPVLVARDLHATEPAGVRAADRIPALAALAIALAGVAWFLTRRVRGTERASVRAPRAHPVTEAKGPGGRSVTLPADPAEALARLADARHEPDEDSGPERTDSPPSA